jgi:formylglycine-generating enzyme required for sulfatase activity
MNSSDKVHEIGALRPSISGLFDQHGNSLEWTSSDPSNRNLFEEGEVKILCGGSYRNVDTKCGARILFQEKIISNFEDYGFRLAQHWETQDE